MQVADLLGITARTARKWVHDGVIKADKIPGTRRWIVLQSEVDRLQGVQSNENTN